MTGSDLSLRLGLLVFCLYVSRKWSAAITVSSNNFHWEHFWVCTIHLFNCTQFCIPQSKRRTPSRSWELTWCVAIGLRHSGYVIRNSRHRYRRIPARLLGVIWLCYICERVPLSWLEEGHPRGNPAPVPARLPMRAWPMSDRVKRSNVP